MWDRRLIDLLNLVGSSKSNQCIACTNIAVQIGERLNILYSLDRCHEFEQKSKFANLNGLLHNVHTIEIVENNEFEDEVTATAAPGRRGTLAGGCGLEGHPIQTAFIEWFQYLERS